MGGKSWWGRGAPGMRGGGGGGKGWKTGGRRYLVKPLERSRGDGRA